MYNRDLKFGVYGKRQTTNELCVLKHGKREKKTARLNLLLC